MQSTRVHQSQFSQTPAPSSNWLPSKVGRIAGIVTALGGALVLLGWILDIPVLLSIVPGFVTMKINAALCFLLVGIALYYVARYADFSTAEESQPSRDAAPMWIGLGVRTGLWLVVGLATFTLMQYVTNWDLGLDQLIGRDRGDVETRHPGRMPPNTAVAFVMVSASLLYLTRPAPQRKLLITVCVMAALTILIGLVSLTGYCARALFGYEPGTLTQMALHTSALFVVVGLACLGLICRTGAWAIAVPRSLVGIFIGALVLLVGVSLLSYRSVMHLVETAEWLRLSELRNSVIRDVGADLVDIQGTVRGYVITGQESYLAAYSTALENLDRHLRQLKNFTLDEPIQSRRVDLLETRIRDRLQFDQQVLDLRRTAGFAPAAELIATGRGQELREPIIELRTKMEQWESDLRHAREAESNMSVTQTALSLPGGTLLTVALFLGVLLHLNAEISDRRRAEEVAREKEQRFRAVFEHAAVGIARVDLDGRILEVNQRYADIVGRNVEDLQHCTFQDITFPEDLPADVTQVKRLLAGEVDTYTLEKRYLRKDRSPVWVTLTASLVRDDAKSPKYFIAVVEDISERKEKERELQRIQWLLSGNHLVESDGYEPPYGDLLALNSSRVILDTVGEPMLKEIAGDFLDLLGSSTAVYEKNGDYALGIFSSGWCRFMDAASRRLCGTSNNRQALECGRWHCHESSWTKTSKVSINTRQPTETDCEGGIRLYAVPITVHGEVVGSINFGFGDPPRDETKLRELAAKYEVEFDELQRHALAYESRPPYIVELAKRRLRSAARLIGEIIERRQAEQKVRQLNVTLEQRVLERTAELAAANQELESFCYSVSHDLRAPLRAVIGYSRIIFGKYQAHLDEDGRKILKTIVDESSRMNLLINDLLALYTNEIEILLVEDNPRDADLTLRALSSGKLLNRVVHLPDGQAALDWIFGEGQFAGRDPNQTPRVVLLDIKLPKVDGTEVLRRLKEHPSTQSVPVVVFTSSAEEKDVVESYRLGANSYIVKPVGFEDFSAVLSELGFYWLALNHPPWPLTSTQP